MERLVDNLEELLKREYFKIVLNQSAINLALSSSTNAVCPGDTILVSASSVLPICLTGIMDK